MAKAVMVERPGVVSQVKLGDGSLPGTISLQTDPGGTFRSGMVIITGIQTQNAVHHQLQPSLGRVTYLYSFGDQPGNITVSGMCFAEKCQSSGRTSGTGVDSLLNYYNNFKASNLDNGVVPLVKLRYGVTPLEGLLVECSTSAEDANSLVTRFRLTIRTLPNLNPMGGSESGTRSGTGPSDLNSVGNW